MKHNSDNGKYLLPSSKKTATAGSRMPPLHIRALKIGASLPGVLCRKPKGEK
jgi:hypothetical protein